MNMIITITQQEALKLATYIDDIETMTPEDRRDRQLSFFIYHKVIDQLTEKAYNVFQTLLENKDLRKGIITDEFKTTSENALQGIDLLRQCMNDIMKHEQTLNRLIKVIDTPPADISFED